MMLMRKGLLVWSALMLSLQEATGFVSSSPVHNKHSSSVPSPADVATSSSLLLLLQMSSNNNDDLEKTFGGYTVKQRLREEVESPFRTVRLFFFGSSTGSALVAFYFSLLTAGKSIAGGFADAPPVDEALQSVAINLAAIVVCGAITYRDWQAGNANLARIKQGGALAKLVVQPASQAAQGGSNQLTTLAEYRRNSRVLIAAGGPEYIRELCRTVNDASTELAQAIASAEIILVPVLMQQPPAGSSSSSSTASSPTVVVGDTAACWKETTTAAATDDDDGDDEFDVTRANAVTGFPRGPAAWADVLQPEVDTAAGQGFDVFEKGITLILKKNGKILRRATGQPQWNGLLGTMEVLDGSKFGMPGDDAIYGTGKPRPNV